MSSFCQSDWSGQNTGLKPKLIYVWMNNLKDVIVSFSFIQDITYDIFSISFLEIYLNMKLKAFPLAPVVYSAAKNSVRSANLKRTSQNKKIILKHAASFVLQPENLWNKNQCVRKVGYTPQFCRRSKLKLYEKK